MTAAMLPSLPAAATNGTDVGPASVDSGVGADPQQDAQQQQQARVLKNTCIIIFGFSFTEIFHSHK